MAEAQATNSIRLNGVNTLPLSRAPKRSILLFGVDIRAPKKPRTKNNRRKNDETRIIHARPIGWIDPTEPTPVYHVNLDSNRSLRLLDLITNKLGGSEMKIILERELKASDVAGQQGRLAILRGDIIDNFLTPEEELKLKNKESLEVKAIDPTLKEWRLKLGRWGYRSKNKNPNGGGYKYVLKYQWNKFMDANPSTFQESALIQVWSFRIQQKLGLAFLRVDYPKTS